MLYQANVTSYSWVQITQPSTDTDNAGPNWTAHKWQSHPAHAEMMTGHQAHTRVDKYPTFSTDTTNIDACRSVQQHFICPVLTYMN